MTPELTAEHLEALADFQDPASQPLPFRLAKAGTVAVYPRSLHELEEGSCFLLRRSSGSRHLGVLSRTSDFDKELESHPAIRLRDGSFFHSAPLSPSNARYLRGRFPFLRPVPAGTRRSFGFGDRLGLANPGHLKALRESGSEFFPVLAQQSVRELDRSGRTAREVLDVATFSALQEGWHSGFGADADHLKDERDLDRYLGAGFRMLTLDPGEYVENEADRLGEGDLRARAETLPWQRLNDTLPSLISRYRDVKWARGPCRLETLRGLVKYGRVILRVQELHGYLRERVERNRFELELSIDETESVTSPFEHFFLVQELKRLGIVLDGLAPRFTGLLEKGIDYRGDLNEFAEHFTQHLEIAGALGGYKLSLHSGSDKFSLYPIVTRGGDRIHVKTAGTSYLEALRTVAEVDPGFFLEIWAFSKEIYPQARSSYHVSAEVEDLPQLGLETPVGNLLDTIDRNEAARQVLHVAFGDVLSQRGGSGTFRFRDRLLDCVDANEKVHLFNLRRHFKRHLEGFRTA